MHKYFSELKIGQAFIGYSNEQWVKLPPVVKPEHIPDYPYEYNAISSKTGELHRYVHNALVEPVADIIKELKDEINDLEISITDSFYNPSGG